MKRLMILVLLSIVQTAGGCTSNPKPVILRRYASYSDAIDVPARVTITVFAVPIPATQAAETSITRLGPEAQAELVKVMANRTENGGAPGLVQALAMPIRGASSTPSFRDLTRHSRRLVFSLDNQSRGPANRVSEARIFVRPLNETQFVSWNRIENVYETVDVGKLSLSQERSTSAELGLTLPVLSASPTVSASAASTLQEELLLRQRRTVLTGTLTASEAVLLQQGGTGIDLTGNVTADFEFRVPAGGDHTVFIPALPDSCVRPSFNRQTIRYPARDSTAPRAEFGSDTAGPSPVLVNVRLEYTLRDVMRGHSTLTESDDSVAFRRGTSQADAVVVIPAETLRFDVFELRMRDSTLYIQGATQSGTANRIAPLQFATFEDALAMLRWTRRCKAPAVGFPVLLGEHHRPLQRGEEDSVYIWRKPINHGNEGGEVPFRRAMSAPPWSSPLLGAGVRGNLSAVPHTTPFHAPMRFGGAVDWAGENGLI